MAVAIQEPVPCTDGGCRDSGAPLPSGLTGVTAHHQSTYKRLFRCCKILPWTPECQPPMVGRPGHFSERLEECKMFPSPRGSIRVRNRYPRARPLPGITRGKLARVAMEAI